MFTPREIGTLFLGDKAHGQNRRRYYNKDGKKRTCWIKSSRHDAPTRYIKVTRAEPKPKLRGPKDIVLRKRFKKILQGELVDFSFLTPLEKRILTVKALGKKHSQIARALSGGRLRRSFTTASIRGRLYRIYNKTREHDMEVIQDGKGIKLQVQRRTQGEDRPASPESGPSPV